MYPTVDMVYPPRPKQPQQHQPAILPTQVPRAQQRQNEQHQKQQQPYQAKNLGLDRPLNAVPSAILENAKRRKQEAHIQKELVTNFYENIAKTPGSCTPSA